MNQFLKKDINIELENLLSFDNDDRLFKYHYQNERIIGKALGKGYARGMSSGTTALQLSLIGLGIEKNDEVISVPNTYIATLLSVSNTGATPKLVDALDSTLLIDPELIEEAITEKTKAIMPVHLYGQMADMQSISRIAKKHNLLVIEDACQAHLARFDDRLPGTLSDSACYSFFPNKNLGGISNGGLVLTKHRKLYKNLEILRNPTSNHPLLLKSHRTPAYLDWIQIPFIKSRMKYLKNWILKRKEFAKIYNEELNDLPIKLTTTDKRADNVYMDFPIRTKKRNRLANYLRRKRIETIVHFNEALHLTKTYSFLGHKKGSFPISEQSCAEVLSLPINPLLKLEQIEFTIKHIKRFFR